MTPHANPVQSELPHTQELEVLNTTRTLLYTTAAAATNK